MRETAPTFIRWLWIWITIAALVVVVVIGFLLGIVGSLSSIDENLIEADTAVTGIKGDAKPLPESIQTINRNLKLIDASLEPIPGQANDILGELGSIRGRLGAIDSSLVDTDASLVDTDASLEDTSNQLGTISSSLVDTSGQLGTISSSLVGTSGTLQTISPSLVDTSQVLRRGVLPRLVDIAGETTSIRGLAERIDNTLEDAQRSRVSEPVSSETALGTNGIWRRVRFLNGGPFERPGDRDDEDNSLRGPGNNPDGLAPIEGDATAILAGLQEVNKHLTSICEAPVLDVPVPLLVNPGPC